MNEMKRGLHAVFLTVFNESCKMTVTQLWEPQNPFSHLSGEEVSSLSLNLVCPKMLSPHLQPNVIVLCGTIHMMRFIIRK